jgi:chromatin remodeling complex protein RSC6
MSSTVAKKSTAPKTTKAAVKEQPVAAAVSPVPAPATSARSSKATSAPVAVAAPVVAATTAPVAEADAEGEVNLVSEFNAQVAKVNELRNSLGNVLADMKKMEKRLARELKRAGRRRRTRAPQLDADGNELPKKPSVFTKPQQITDALCVFLGKPKGTLMSRSDVTRGIMTYVKDKKLNNKQDINPDAALRKLLAVSETEKVTILNLQRFLKTHYIKAPVV